jgi:hypothetical protein
LAKSGKFIFLHSFKSFNPNFFQFDSSFAQMGFTSLDDLDKNFVNFCKQSVEQLLLPSLDYTTHPPNHPSRKV